MPDPGTPAPASLIRRINRAVGTVISALEVSVLVICVGLLAVLLIANVIFRTFFESLYFAEELSMFLVLLITFMGVSYGVRKARHIRMGAFLDAMSPTVERIFLIFICSVSAIVMGLMAWYSFQYLENAMSRGHTSPALRLPKWTFYIVVPIGFALSAIQYLRTVVKNLTEKEPWQSPDQQSEYEDEILPGAPPE